MPKLKHWLEAQKGSPTGRSPRAMFEDEFYRERRALFMKGMVVGFLHGSVTVATIIYLLQA